MSMVKNAEQALDGQIYIRLYRVKRGFAAGNGLTSMRFEHVTSEIANRHTLTNYTGLCFVRGVY